MIKKYEYDVTILFDAVLTLFGTFTMSHRMKRGRCISDGPM